MCNWGLRVRSARKPAQSDQSHICELKELSRPQVCVILTTRTLNKLISSSNVHNLSQHYKTFLCLTQLRMTFFLLVNAKMPTIVGILAFISRLNMTSFLLMNFTMPTSVGILTFISRINTILLSFKARKLFDFQHLNYYEQLKLS